MTPRGACEMVRRQMDGRGDGQLLPGEEYLRKESLLKGHEGEYFSEGAHELSILSWP